MEFIHFTTSCATILQVVEHPQFMSAFCNDCRKLRCNEFAHYTVCLCEVFYTTCLPIFKKVALFSVELVTQFVYLLVWLLFFSSTQCYEKVFKHSIVCTSEGQGIYERLAHKGKAPDQSFVNVVSRITSRHLTVNFTFSTVSWKSTLMSLFRLFFCICECFSHFDIKR